MILVRPGDLVVSGINAAKGAIAIYDADAADPIAATIHYGAYIPKPDRVGVDFLWWMLRSRFFRELLLEHVPGGIKTELKAKRLLPVPIPLPPLSEQRRIVARIEQLAKRMKIVRTTSDAMSLEIGSLMPAYYRLLIDEAGWTSRRLGDILREPPRNGLSPKPEVEVGGRPMLRINAVSSAPTRYVDVSAVKMVAVADEDARPFAVQQDDVFIVRYNGDMDRVAKPAIYRTTSDAAVLYPDKLMRLRPNRSVMLPDFLVLALNAASVRRQVEELGRTTAGNIGVNGANASSFVLPVPPLSDQRRIVAELDAMQAKVDEVKKLQAETQAELDALLPSILDRAFKGEL
jgi:type I restriction enzyme S subunit